MRVTVETAFVRIAQHFPKHKKKIVNMKIYNFCRAKNHHKQRQMVHGEVSATPILDKGTNLLNIYKIPSNQYEKD